MIDAPPAAPRIQRRQPAWSGGLTGPMARLIPQSLQPGAMIGIKALHTALFLSIAAALVLTLWDGLRSRPTRRTAVAGSLVVAETAVYLSNNQVCPLTPLAEAFGSEHGSVVDMFLPASMARRIPLVAGTAAALSLGLNLRALARR